MLPDTMGRDSNVKGKGGGPKTLQTGMACKGEQRAALAVLPERPGLREGSGPLWVFWTSEARQASARSQMHACEERRTSALSSQHCCARLVCGDSAGGAVRGRRGRLEHGGPRLSQRRQLAHLQHVLVQRHVVAAQVVAPRLRGADARQSSPEHC